MSKKIAEGTGALVLDVKVGSGAFMKDVDDARELAAHDGRARHRRTACAPVALLTDMSTPLGLHRRQRARGRRVGRGAGRRRPADVVELTLALAREMLAAAGLADVDPADGAARRLGRWTRGGAMIAAQGGDPDAPLPTARRDPRRAGAGRRRAGPAGRLRASASPPGGWAPGRARKEDPVQAGAGVELHAKPGDRGRAGEPLLTLHTDDAGPVRRPRSQASPRAVEVATRGTPADRLPLVLDRIGA